MEAFSLLPTPLEATHTSTSHTKAAAAWPIQIDENCICPWLGTLYTLVQKLGSIQPGTHSAKRQVGQHMLQLDILSFLAKIERLLSRGILSIHSQLNYELEKHQPCSVIQYMPFFPPGSCIFTPL